MYLLMTQKGWEIEKNEFIGARCNPLDLIRYAIRRKELVWQTNMAHLIWTSWSFSSFEKQLIAILRNCEWLKKSQEAKLGFCWGRERKDEEIWKLRSALFTFLREGADSTSNTCRSQTKIKPKSIIAWIGVCKFRMAAIVWDNWKSRNARTPIQAAKA